MQTATLRDGSRVVIRPVEPADRELLAAGFERLSPESRYRRFFSPRVQLTERDLDYLTQVDHHDHEALVVLAAGTGEGVAVARFVRTAPDAAEPAIVVADDWQGRGVATVLMDALVERAREVGVRRFDAPVLAINSEAIRVLQRLGHTTRRSAGTEVELHIELPDPQQPVGFSELLREFAEGAVAPARTVLDLLRPRRAGRPEDPRCNRIVVGTDGSPHGAYAVEVAAALAAASGAPLHVVGVHPFLLPEQQTIVEAVRGSARALRERGLRVHEHLRRGDAGEVLADVAEEQDARLLVVGAGGRGGAARRLLGSTADTVTSRAPCDVLIARPRPRH